MMYVLSQARGERVEARYIVVMWCSTDDCPYCTSSFYDQDIKFCRELGGKQIPASNIIPDVCPLSNYELKLTIEDYLPEEV